MWSSKDHVDLPLDLRGLVLPSCSIALSILSSARAVPWVGLITPRIALVMVVTPKVALVAPRVMPVAKVLVAGLLP